jgi:predicted 3-demethylubiquinone-9 3-methyltransferase (glyoxalase superfamily)
MNARIQKVTPFLWFDNQAEEAVNFYLSVFPNSSFCKLTRYGKGGGGPEGEVMLVSFQLEGQEFAALNGGPQFKFTEAISFVVNCETQDEVDQYWEKLSSGGGEKSKCGWLKDRYGVSWQVVPVSLIAMLQSRDADASARVMQAMLQMDKLDISTLEEAYR